MAHNAKALFSIAGVFKLFELILAIVTFLLARVGYEGYTAAFGSDVDAQWIGFIATGGWLIILPSIIVGILAGDEHPWRMDTILNIVGCVMYIAAGSLAIDYHNSDEAKSFSSLPELPLQTTPINIPSGKALGSMCIITGIFLGIDAVMLVVMNAKKEKK